MNPMIEIRHLSFSHLFESFTLVFSKGDFHVIAGGNQSGKSVLIQILTNQIKTENTVIVDHTYIESYSSCQLFELMGTNVILMKKIKGITVLDELIRPLTYLGWKKEQINQQIHEVVTKCQQEAILLKKISELSKKEESILLFFLAIIHFPKVVLLDEPFLWLSKEEKQIFLDYLHQLNQEKQMTIILTTKDLSDAIGVDKLFIIDHGKLLIEGTPYAVFQEDKILNRIGLPLPFLADLSLKLMFYKVLDHFILDMDRMVEQLWK